MKPIFFKQLGFILCMGTAIALNADTAPESKAPPGVQISKDAPVPQGVVLSVRGSSQYSADGKRFTRLKTGDVLHQGAVVRTAKDSHVDVFLQRLAITVRLTSETELGLEKMAKYKKEGHIVMETILDLRAGQIFCFVRGLVPNSRFEVKHSAGRSVVEGEGSGGFEIRADSAAVTPRTSFIPLKVISEKGVAVIAPGQRFDAKQGKTLELAPTEIEDTLMQLDELQALADLLSTDEASLKKE